MAEIAMSTQEAAELLGVSPAFLDRLLDEGALPCRHVGGQRVVQRQDVLAHEIQMRQTSEVALQALVDQGQDLGLGYDVKQPDDKE